MVQAPRVRFQPCVQLLFFGLGLLSFKFTIVIFYLTLFVPLSFAQVVVNGQVFTNGLSIVDSPQPQTPFGAGSDIPFAVDVSGNGKLPQSASFPALAGTTRFVDLQIYLVSADTNINLTVSGSGILAQETGSTVKHLSFPIPGCTPAGQYNLTVYESSIIENQPYFSITPIPIAITSQTGTTAQCTMQGNPVQSQPQPSSPFPQNPWLAGTGGPQSPLPGPPNPVNPGVFTITMGPNGALPSPFPPLFTTTASTTVTVVLVSTETATVTTTESGQKEIYITTYVRSSTTTAVIKPTATDDLSGFVPVNAVPMLDDFGNLRIFFLGLLSAYLVQRWL